MLHDVAFRAAFWGNLFFLYRISLCKATELYYVTTAGGPYDPTYSYGYIESLAKNFFGIPETYLVKAEMLDIEGNDAEETLNLEIDRIMKNGIL